MKRPLRLALWIVYGGMMAAAGWVFTGPGSSDSPTQATPRRASKSRPARALSAAAGLHSVPLLHERIEACFGHWRDAENAPSLDQKLSELDSLRSYELEELGAVLLAAELTDGKVEESVEELTTRIQDGGPGSWEARDALRALLERVADRDPDRAWSLLNNLPKDLLDDDEPFCKSLLIARLKKDPDSVFKYVINKHSYYNCQREWLWELVARELAATDLEAARKALTNMPGDHGRAISAIAIQWSKSDPEAAVRWASRFGNFHPDPVVAVFHDWMERDPRAALALEDQYRIATLSGSMSVREQLATYWARIDPEAALDWGLSEDGKHYLREIANAAGDPSHLLQLTRARSAAAELRIAPHLAGKYARTKPAEALAWLRTLPDCPEAAVGRMRALNNLGYMDASSQQLGRDHFAELWHPETDMTRIGRGYHYGQEGVAEGILKLFADDPLRLFEIVDQATEVNPDQFHSLIYDVTNLNYQATADYLLTRLDQTSASTVERFLERWEDEDPDAAAAFTANHPEIIERAKEE